ncbi:MAG: hypothetical protein IR160_02050 [Salinibacterium sp.]|nr:hypothetical protein [Salinibacterium sp.]MBF0671350.1 hypothetical protein [Salinibacterium sp.]
MPKYEDSPDQAEASLQSTNDEVGRLDDALSAAEQRAEDLEREIDNAYSAGDATRQVSLEAEMEQLQLQIQDINTDLEAAHQAHANNVESWGLR